MKDYNQLFRNLVNEAINDGWHPLWHDRSEGNDIWIHDDYIDAPEEEEEATEYFSFYSPSEWDEMEAENEKWLSEL